MAAVGSGFDLQAVLMTKSVALSPVGCELVSDLLCSPGRAAGRTHAGGPAARGLRGGSSGAA